MYLKHLYVSKVRMETVLAQYFHKDGSVALNGVSNNNTRKIKLALSEKQNIRKNKISKQFCWIIFLKINIKRFF